jgi:phenylacetate-coenzyme A ligase PaaK-like adenylate-forming protein
MERVSAFGNQSTLGATCKVQLVGPQQIQRSEGKAVRALDEQRG